jgi:hypothetical protein
MTFRHIFASSGFLAAGLFAFAVACSSSSNSPGSNASSACGDYFDALGAQQQCNLGTALSSPEETARQRALWVNASCPATLSMPGVNITSDGLEKCAQALKAAPCGATPQECSADLAHGSLGAGAGCFVDAQCASGSCNLSIGTITGDGGAAQTVCGACAAPVAEGAPCAGSSNQCAPGTACVPDGSGTSQVVCKKVAYVGAGEACGAATRCQTNLMCSSQGICTPIGASGASCDGDHKCGVGLVCRSGHCSNGGAAGDACDASNACNVGFVCDAASSKCKPQVWAKPGEACSEEVQCEAGFCAQTDPTTLSGTCPVILHEGDACDSSFNSSSSAQAKECDANLTCVGGKCITVASAAASCK